MKQRILVYLKYDFIEDFKCNCCGRGKPLKKLMLPLERLIEEIINVYGDRKYIKITSGYRCPLHNRDVGGSKTSQHNKRKAVDLIVYGVKPLSIARIANLIPEFSDGGIGVYRTFVHLDVRDRKARWGNWKG